MIILNIIKCHVKITNMLNCKYPNRLKKKKITETIELQEVTSNMLKHSLQNKSLQPPVIGAYDFEMIFRDTDDQSKLGELRKNKN